ncbi:transposase family protein [Streptomyces sp. NPDC001933]|uniref:transposase family protein n=1 Tax=Streptomyces sp. NPDC001933 TaxID=3364626 RepID=UPI003690A818
MLPRSTSRATSWIICPACRPRTDGASALRAAAGRSARFRQAVLVLRWFRERGCVHCLARDTGVSQATGYRYLHEDIDVLANQTPVDGTLIESDRLAGVRDNSNDLWFSQKHKTFGGNVQFLSAPDGTPLWVSDAEPGSTPDISADGGRLRGADRSAGAAGSAG